MLPIVLLQDFFQFCWLFSGILLSGRSSPFWNQSTSNFWGLWFAGSIKFSFLFTIAAHNCLSSSGPSHHHVIWLCPLIFQDHGDSLIPALLRIYLYLACGVVLLLCATVCWRFIFYFHIYCFYEGTREDSFLKMLHHCHILAIRNSKWSFKSINQTM